MTEPTSDKAPVPARACDITPGKVIHTFDGDLPVTSVHTTASGFRLVQFPGRPIRPYHPDDVVYLVEDGAS